MEINQLTEKIIGAAIAVHRELGPGLLESTYEACMAAELVERGMHVSRQQAVHPVYKGVELEGCYRIDMIVEGVVVLEFKSVEKIEPVHAAQVLTYLRFSRCKVGLLLNFNVAIMKDGIRRIVLGLQEGSPRTSAASAPLR